MKKSRLKKIYTVSNVSSIGSTPMAAHIATERKTLEAKIRDSKVKLRVMEMERYAQKAYIRSLEAQLDILDVQPATHFDTLPNKLPDNDIHSVATPLPITMPDPIGTVLVVAGTTRDAGKRFYRSLEVLYLEARHQRKNKTHFDKLDIDTRFSCNWYGSEYCNIRSDILETCVVLYAVENTSEPILNAPRKFVRGFSDFLKPVLWQHGRPHNLVDNLQDLCPVEFPTSFPIDG